jgi:hypothetical protein
MTIPERKRDRIAQLASSRIHDPDPNMARANWGEAGILAADPDWGTNEVSTSARDAIANICHALSRMGLNPYDVVMKGLDSYEQDGDEGEIGGGPAVRWDRRRFPNPEEVPTL